MGAEKAGPLRVGVLVVSDKGSRGERLDETGPAVAAFLAEQGLGDPLLEIVPDERAVIARRLAAWTDDLDLAVILTCGGTGVSVRDVTPEATLEVIDRELPGFGERMRAASFRATPRALISRATAGVRCGTLIVNLPGSPRAAVQNLAAVWDAVPHLVAKLRGDAEDCGGG